MMANISLRPLIRYICTTVFLCSVSTNLFSLPSKIEGDSIKSESIAPDTTEERKIPLFLDQLPSAFAVWVQNQVIQPTDDEGNSINGVVNAQFCIDSTGRVCDIIILESPNHLLSLEAIRCISISPKWTPGTINGRETNFILRIRLSFYNSTGQTMRILPDKMPLFKGGDLDSFKKWVISQIEQTKGSDGNVLSGKANISFTVNVEGRTQNCVIESSTNDELSIAAKQIIDRSPLWLPAIYNMKALNFRHNISIDITDYSKEIEADTSDDIIYVFADKLPLFKKKDIDKFQKWVYKQVYKTTDENGERIYGSITVEFVVDRNGEIADVKILQSPNKIMSRKIIETILDSPRWTPAKIKGRNVNFKFTLPIDIYPG